MKVRITHMKAPWPSGAVVGNVVELPVDAVPAWALGKCQRLGDDVEAEFVVNPAPPAREFVVNPADETEPLSDVEQQAADERAAIEAAKPAKAKK